MKNLIGNFFVVIGTYTLALGLLFKFGFKESTEIMERIQDSCKSYLFHRYIVDKFTKACKK